MTTISETVKSIMLLEAFAEEAKRLAGLRRDELGLKARKQLEEDGTAPSWHVPAVAKVTLGVTKTAAYVSDVAKLTAWAAARHPQQIEQVIRPAFVTSLLASLEIEGEVAVDKETGEIVPGIGVRQGGMPKNLSIVAERGVKAGMAELVTGMLATAHPELTAGPAEPALPAPDDPWLPSGDPFAAFPPAGAQ